MRPHKPGLAEKISGNSGTCSLQFHAFDKRKAPRKTVFPASKDLEIEPAPAPNEKHPPTASGASAIKTGSAGKTRHAPVKKPNSDCFGARGSGEQLRTRSAIAFLCPGCALRNGRRQRVDGPDFLETIRCSGFAPSGNGEQDRNEQQQGCESVHCGAPVGGWRPGKGKHDARLPPMQPARIANTIARLGVSWPITRKAGVRVHSSKTNREQQQ